MGKIEVTIFIVLVGIIILIFIAGLIIFIFQYRHRRLLHLEEKGKIEEQHRTDLLNIQLEIQKQTMQFIGSEIHDSVTQKLTLASISTQRMEFENLHPDILNTLQSISRIINDSLGELRDLSRSLTESDFNTVELSNMLLRECERVNETGICKATLLAGDTVALNILTKKSLLRTIQEFTQNSLKHAGCTEIAIKLYNDEQGLYLTACDNGKGFDTASAYGRGIGLNNMRRRIQTIGGTFNLKSNLQEGTILYLFIPESLLH